ncbi:sensor histidine kinase [Caldicoprobacter algeriensis]|uniref:sensor histidine kinase n=1 Tax=Caldicoprobacter algeriensis TaxID=699281 RepID=UPI002079BB54|nr:sensor histidine kinase [Caldicoprobacter algeriensis]
MVKSLLSWQKFSLSKKLIVSYIFILAIPLILYAMYTFHKIKQTTQEDFIKNEVQNLQEIKFQIYRNIEICQRVSQFIASNKELLEFISRDNGFDTQEFIEFKNIFLTQIERLLYTNPDIYRLRLFINRDDFPEIWPLIYHDKRVLHEHWYVTKEQWDREVYWELDHIFQPFNIANSERSRVTTMYRKIWGPGNQYLGALEISMLVSQFFGNMNTNTANSDGGFAVIQDNQDMFFYGDTFLDRIGIKADELKSLLIMQANNQEEGVHILKINNKPVIMVYTTIHPISSTIYRIVSIENMVNRLNRTRNLLVLVTLGGFIVFSAVTYTFTSVILKKMRIIVNCMKKVQAGNLDVDIPVYGCDEVAELAQCFNKMMARIKELISIVVKKELISKETELKALHSQINAHFLYNVLENIKMMAEIDGIYEVADALTSLGRLMRYSMSWKKDKVSLGDELAYIDNYIKLINIRYDYEISCVYNVDEELLNCEICKMSIQPIVENAVIHGIQPKGQGGIIKITAWIQEEHLIVEVFDDGKGIKPVDLKRLKEVLSTENESNQQENEHSRGIGLKNVDQRIKLAYGPQYGITIDSIEGKYTKVRLVFPYIRNSYLCS